MNDTIETADDLRGMLPDEILAVVQALREELRVATIAYRAEVAAAAGWRKRAQTLEAERDRALGQLATAQAADGPDVGREEVQY